MTLIIADCQMKIPSWIPNRSCTIPHILRIDVPEMRRTLKLYYSGKQKKVFQIQTRTKTSSGNSSSNGTQRRLDVCVSHSDTVSNSWLVVIETQIFIQCSKWTIAGKYVPISSHFSTESILDLDAWIFNWCIHSNYITLDENGTFLVHSIFTFKTRLVSKLFCVLFFAKCCLVQHLCDQSVCMYWVKIIQ